MADGNARVRYAVDEQGDVVGYDPRGVSYGVVYDFIEDRAEAEVIRDLLNEGAGPGWDEIRDEVHARLELRKGCKDEPMCG